MKVGIIVCGIVIALIVIGAADRYFKGKELRKKLALQFAGPVKNMMSAKRLASLGAYRDSLFSRIYDIDSITWNDLELDRVFAELNRTQSAVGEEYLYASLFRPEFSDNELTRRERLISLFSENEALRNEVLVALARLGKIRDVSLYQYLTSFEGVQSDGYFRHLIPILGYLGAVASAFLYPDKPTITIFLVIFAAGYSIVSYFKRKSEIEPYLRAMTFVSNWVGAVDTMSRSVRAKDTPLADELEVMRETARGFSSFRRGTYLLVSESAGDVAQLLLDYVRMLTHVDLIKFNRMCGILKEKKSDLERLFEDTGRIDMAMAIASYRAYRAGEWCLPELSQEDDAVLEFTDLTHPMIAGAVPNSLRAERSVLLTGSNASGKSTFLKTVAVNALLAQTIHTVLGKAYKGKYYRILSSMALRDDLAAKESYYIVEIRSLKRILDAAEEEEPVLCFVDEVLRGTNTAERIAASGRILRYLAASGALCFAATHDLELTDHLRDCFEMKHFSETVTEESLTFDYTLKDGKATSRNAIRLLRLFGYPEEIVDQADRDAVAFLARNGG